MKKTLTILLSFVMIVTAIYAMPLSVYASDYYEPSVIETNTENIKNYIYKNGYINGNGNYSIEEVDYGQDYYGLYHITIVDGGYLKFNAAWYEIETDELFANTNFVLNNFPGTIIYNEFNIWLNGNNLSDITAYCYMNSSFHHSLNPASIYVAKNGTSAPTSDIISTCYDVVDDTFTIWNNMLNQKMGLNLGAVGFYNYCTVHNWNSGEIQTQSTPVSEGTMLHLCTICGATKTSPIAKCAKYNNPVTAKGKTSTIKYSKLKKKNQSVSVKNAFTINNAQGKVTYKKTSGNKKITVSSSGKITVKKGLKKGKYKVKVKVTAAGNASYNSGSKTVTVTVKVK